MSLWVIIQGNAFVVVDVLFCYPRIVKQGNLQNAYDFLYYYLGKIYIFKD